MKIQNILNEDIGPALAYKQLTPLQIGLLKKIVDHRFDYDSASPQAQEAVNILIDLGLVNELSLEATERGELAYNYAAKYGSTERRQLNQARQQVATRTPEDTVTEPEFEMEID